VIADLLALGKKKVTLFVKTLDLHSSRFAPRWTTWLVYSCQCLKASMRALMVRFRPFNTIFEKKRSRSGCSFSHSALGLLTITVFELTGLGRGGQQVQQCKKAFKQAVELLVELASMQV